MMTVRETSRDEVIDQLTVTLVQRASLLTRLVFRHARPGISRTESSLLLTLRGGPQRITTLAELEGVAQPTVTLLVSAMQESGWVVRERDPQDRRVVLVSLTERGRAALDEARERYRPIMHARLAELPDEQLAALESASEALASLIDAFQDEAR